MVVPLPAGEECTVHGSETRTSNGSFILVLASESPHRTSPACRRALELSLGGVFVAGSGIACPSGNHPHLLMTIARPLHRLEPDGRPIRVRAMVDAAVDVADGNHPDLHRILDGECHVPGSEPLPTVGAAEGVD